MTNFNRQIFSGKQSLEFDFERISKGNGHKYHISVKDSNGMHHFTMERAGEKWHISLAPAPAQWIIALEKELEEVILNHETTGKV